MLLHFGRVDELVDPAQVEKLIKDSEKQGEVIFNGFYGFPFVKP